MGFFDRLSKSLGLSKEAPEEAPPARAAEPAAPPPPVAEPVAEAPAAEPVAAAPAGATVVRLRQPLEGKVVSIEEVPDPTFATGIMGPGIAIEPTGDLVVAPADATVSMAFHTGHAIALTLEDGTELLIHIGMDTVTMGGDGFEVLVAQGDKVTVGTPLIRFDLAKITAAGHPTVTPVIVLNNKEAVIEFG
jgi:PTS system N-acetylglucosamine-specific IIC component